MKYLLHLTFTFCLLILLFNDSVHANEAAVEENKAIQIVEKNAQLLDGISQLLVVFNDSSESSLARLIPMEKSGRHWKVKSDPIPVYIGRNGFAAPGTKREGDGKSPTGLFRLGQLFCYEKTPRTRMPYLQTTNDDKWIDDPDSKDYNRHIRGETNAKSYERLRLQGIDYKYCMVIEYNTQPVLKNMGSAIFLHLLEKIPEPTSGCVALNEKDMSWLLKWMKPKSKPSIIMGNEKILVSGFIK